LVPLARLEEELPNTGFGFDYRALIGMVFDSIQIAWYLDLAAHEK
jgi:hypothetical protein